MWKSSYQSMTLQLEALRQDHGVKDAEIGLAVIELLQTNSLAQGELKDVPGARLPIVALGWWLFVRAPWLQAAQLTLATMTLDLMINAQRSLDEVLADIATLEQSSEDQVDQEPPYDELVELMRALEPLAKPPEALEDEDLSQRILDAFALMREHKDAVDEAKAKIMSRLLDEFGELGKSGSLKPLYDLDQSTSHLGESSDVIALLEASQKAYQEGELGQALDGFNEVLANEPDNPEALVGRGVIRATSNNLDGALEDLDRAIESRQDYTIAWINRGLIHYANQALEQAIADFSSALEVDGTLVEAWLNRSSARAQQGLLEEALEDVNQAVKLAPGMARARVDRAVIHRAMGNVVAATRDYEEATGLDPYHADAWAGRGFLLLEIGELEAAKQDLTRAIELEPWRSVLYYNRGNAYAGTGNFEEAIADYDSVLEIDEDDIEARMNRGTAKLKLGDFKGALEDWDRIIRIAPHQPDAYLRRGVVLMMGDEANFAVRDFEQALAVAPAGWTMREVTKEKLAEARELAAKTSN